MGSTWEGNSTMMAVYLAIFVLALIVTLWLDCKRGEKTGTLLMNLILVGWIVQTLMTNLWHLQFGEQSYSDKEKFVLFEGDDSNEVSIIAWSACLIFVVRKRLQIFTGLMPVTVVYVAGTNACAWWKSFPHPATQIVETVWTILVLCLLLNMLWRTGNYSRV